MLGEQHTSALLLRALSFDISNALVLPMLTFRAYPLALAQLAYLR